MAAVTFVSAFHKERDGNINLVRFVLGNSALICIDEQFDAMAWVAWVLFMLHILSVACFIKFTPLPCTSQKCARTLQIFIICCIKSVIIPGSPSVSAKTLVCIQMIALVLVVHVVSHL